MPMPENVGAQRWKGRLKIYTLPAISANLLFLG
jgi:hypothetical protein